MIPGRVRFEFCIALLYTSKGDGCAVREELVPLRPYSHGFRRFVTGNIRYRH